MDLGNLKEVKFGKSLHSICIKTGLDRDVFVQNNMMTFYWIDSFLGSALVDMCSGVGSFLTLIKVCLKLDAARQTASDFDAACKDQLSQMLQMLHGCYVGDGFCTCKLLVVGCLPLTSNGPGISPCFMSALCLFSMFVGETGISEMQNLELDFGVVVYIGLLNPGHKLTKRVHHAGGWSNTQPSLFV
ncbi:hypothetical protein L1049_021375 [Liquidambar formosana]|uniref:Uncharacterized protein n=1 Tax=Liquidambar formosana TaxID=63359 RepID=A0AAP0N8C6_LIQFO